MIHLLTDSEFKSKILESDIPALVDIWAKWCNPCRSVIPILENISHKYHHKLNFFKLDVDENPSIVQKYDIRSVPTLLFFKKGELVATRIGVFSELQLEEFLTSHLN